MSRKSVLLFLMALLSVATWMVWSVAFALEKQKQLTVSFLDVGQGDSILIESPTGAHVLIDGGKDRAVLRGLSKTMPWWDREIDVVIATHPDADHVGGLFEVLSRYEVHTIMHPGVAHDTPQAESLFSAVGREVGSGAKEILARRGQRLDIGGGAYIDILFPDRDVSGVETNTASIVARVVYGETSFLLTGDSPQAIEEYLVSLDGEKLHAQVLKAGHHGSNTSSSPLFVGFASPEWVVFSRGCDNSYGHPHAEVVDLYKRFEIQSKDTCIDGTVIFELDGARVLAK